MPRRPPQTRPRRSRSPTAKASRAPRQLREEPLRDRGLRQLLRDEVAGARTETRPGMRARADVPEAGHGSLVTGSLCQRAPEEILVERARAAVDVAADEISVERLEAGRRDNDALQRRGTEVLDRVAKPGDDAIGIRLAELVGPAAVARVEVAGGIGLDSACRKFLQLDPDDRLAIRRAGRVERHRLATDDRRLGREEPSLCLVDGPRDAVETRGDVDNRAAGKALRLAPLPARRLVERQVDLHLRTPVAEPRRRLGDARRHVRAAEERT